MARINRLQHIVLNCRDVDASIDFYTRVLGMEIVSHNPDRNMAFLSFGKEHHDIALFPYREPADRLEKNHLGLNHIALEIEGGEQELRDYYQHLKTNEVEIDGTMDHVMSQSIYFFDPDGNRIEVFADMLHDEAKEWLHQNGGVAKPLVLEEVAGD